MRHSMGCVRVLRHSAAVKLPIPEQVAHQRWLLGRLRNRRFYGLAEVNNAIRELLVRLNEERPIGRFGVTRRQLHGWTGRP